MNIASIMWKLKYSMIHHIEIETIRHCNARCVFCPQSLDPLPADTMSLELFEHICKEIKNIGPLHNDFFVTLNHYGEPLLDKFFEERIKLLDKYKLHVVLHTNGTKLDYSKTKFLHGPRTARCATS